MKKTKAITAAIGLCMAAALFAGCDNGSTTHETAAVSVIAGGQATVATNNVQTAAPVADVKFALNHNGYKIYPGMNIDEALSILGDNYDEVAQANCAGQGMGYDYVYDDYMVQLSVPASNADGSIAMIDVYGKLVDCGGVYVGDSVEKAKTTFGEPSQDDTIALYYEADGINMTVFYDQSGVITEIILQTVAE